MRNELFTVTGNEIGHKIDRWPIRSEFDFVYLLTNLSEIFSLRIWLFSNFNPYF